MKLFYKNYVMTLDEWLGYMNDVPAGWEMSQTNECGSIQRYINGIPVIITDEEG